MNDNNFISYKDLRRNPRRVFGKLYQDENFVKCLRNVEDIVQKNYSLYKKECSIKISKETQGWLDCIVAHFRHRNFLLEVMHIEDYHVLIFDLTK